MGGLYLPPIYICHCIRSRNDTDLVYQYARHLCSIDWGGLSASYIYMHCIRSGNDTDLVYQYARHLCLIEQGGLSVSYIYVLY